LGRQVVDWQRPGRRVALSFRLDESRRPEPVRRALCAALRLPVYWLSEPQDYSAAETHIPGSKVLRTPRRSRGASWLSPVI